MKQYWQKPGPYFPAPGYLHTAGLNPGSLNLVKGLTLLLCFAMLMLTAVSSRAGTGGSVSGTVKDASGAVVPGASVSVNNLDTGVGVRLTTNGRGFYSFPEVPVGRYTLTIEKTGFRPYQRTAIAIDTDSAFIVDVVLEVGAAGNAVTVIDTAVHAETSETQMGEVISGKKMAAVPLNGRSYTDLLALQPGVVPTTSLTSNTQQDVGMAPVHVTCRLRGLPREDACSTPIRRSAPPGRPPPARGAISRFFPAPARARAAPGRDRPPGHSRRPGRSAPLRPC